ncbi:MAG: hypothetical protein IIZ25_11815 [Thermoguttaceae bacterium]|nr:hypothetical protein [Thermoguttaceae bacterium]
MSKKDSQGTIRQSIIMDDLYYIAQDLRQRREAERMANMTPTELDSQRRRQEISDGIVKFVGFGCLFVVLFIFFLILFYAIVN